MDAIAISEDKASTQTQARLRPKVASASKFRLLLTDAFIDDFTVKLANAKTRIYIQVLTFDGDDSGQRVAALLKDAASRGVEVQVLIDSFAKRFVSDTRVGHPSVAAEAKATAQMYESLRQAGVTLRFTRPNGPFNIFALTRNHKKIFVIDDVCYLGGINISDHNWSWHDFNVKVTDRRRVNAVAGDFLETMSGVTSSKNDGTLVTNTEIEAVFDELVTSATKSVVLASPYAVDIGLAQLFEKATAPKKVLITNARSNLRIYRMIQPYLVRRLTASGLQIQNFETFSHCKFLLVDDTKLFVGSSNFGRHSFWCNEEIALLVQDQTLITAVRAQLVKSSTTGADNKQNMLGLAGGAALSHLMHLWLKIVRKSLAKRVKTLSE